MKVLKIEVSCGKVRWIFSALSTLILVVLLLFFPFWNSMSATKAVTSSFEKGAYLVTSMNSATGRGNPIDLLLDFVRMLFAPDLIKAGQMVRILKNRQDQLDELYKKNDAIYDEKLRKEIWKLL